ncbi:MAG: hypothetical protein NUV98_00350 [Candidatus Roizmanbacteria bacterium]|nr:hypothetical protein [Candidatus Roizmanbacteria bacterium]
MKKSKRFKLIGTGILGIPTAFLLLFLFGELFSGDVSGIAHIVQIVAVVLVLLVSWKYPRIGGWILVIVGFTLGIVYTKNDFPFATLILVETLLFIPPIIAGFLFILSAKHPRQQ